jgi:AcrR family transcriptional regulator
MTEVKRRYQSALRERQAAETRAAVLTAARELFLEQGYGATTVEQVAARAGVSKPTVFTAVGNKQALLKTVRDVAMAGDDQPTAVEHRPSVQLARDAGDAHSALQHITAHITALASRYAALHEVLRGAAASGEPELRDLWLASDQQRHEGAKIFVQILLDKGSLRPGLDANLAADLLDHFMDPSGYRHFVHNRGWPAGRYQRWLAETLTEQLLPGPHDL